MIKTSKSFRIIALGRICLSFCIVFAIEFCVNVDSHIKIKIARHLYFLTIEVWFISTSQATEIGVYLDHPKKTASRS